MNGLTTSSHMVMMHTVEKLDTISAKEQHVDQDRWYKNDTERIYDQRLRNYVILKK